MGILGPKLEEEFPFLTSAEIHALTNEDSYRLYMLNEAKKQTELLESLATHIKHWGTD